MHSPAKPSGLAPSLLRAFPSGLADDVRAVLAVVPRGESGLDPFLVEVSGETVAIPGRLHHDEPDPAAVRSLTGTQREILHCLYTRNTDGMVRQRHLERIAGLPRPWVAPFVLLLTGEYVVQILEAIRRGLPGLDVPGSAERALYGDLVVRNGALFALTEQRAVSYWAEYHRWKYPVFGTYPGGLLTEAFRDAASERAGKPWPSTHRMRP
ncbi:hypothetical protein [Streptomyces sp. NPDC092952]|uniref:hypothetical protein n=1 Tax=Streptomyces sp. NPDC092952 TaxID=3366018 RepID=UPI00380B1F70